MPSHESRTTSGDSMLDRSRWRPETTLCATTNWLGSNSRVVKKWTFGRAASFEKRACWNTSLSGYDRVEMWTVSTSSWKRAGQRPEAYLHSVVGCVLPCSSGDPRRPGNSGAGRRRGSGIVAPPPFLRRGTDPTGRRIPENKREVGMRHPLSVSPAPFRSGSSGLGNRLRPRDDVRVKPAMFSPGAVRTQVQFEVTRRVVSSVRSPSNPILSPRRATGPALVSERPQMGFLDASQPRFVERRARAEVDAPEPSRNQLAHEFQAEDQTGRTLRVRPIIGGDLREERARVSGAVDPCNGRAAELERRREELAFAREGSGRGDQELPHIACREPALLFRPREPSEVVLDELLHAPPDPVRRRLDDDLQRSLGLEVSETSSIGTSGVRGQGGEILIPLHRQGDGHEWDGYPPIGGDESILQDLGGGVRRRRGRRKVPEIPLAKGPR